MDLHTYGTKPLNFNADEAILADQISQDYSQDVISYLPA